MVGAEMMKQLQAPGKIPPAILIKPGFGIGFQNIGNY
jgi:hypothetical protein